MTEVERKFLVNNERFKKEAFDTFSIKQGFLNTHPERTVRVRVRGEQGWITIKGISSQGGTSREEWEYLVPKEEAEQLLELCEAGVIDKTRYLVSVENHLYEVDVFSGSNEGLIVAEIELNHPDDPYPKPDWLGEEVTGDTRYYNSMLSQKPYKNW